MTPDQHLSVDWAADGHETMYGRDDGDDFWNGTRWCRADEGDDMLTDEKRHNLTIVFEDLDAEGLQFARELAADCQKRLRAEVTSKKAALAAEERALGMLDEAPQAKVKVRKPRVERSDKGKPRIRRPNTPANEVADKAEAV